MDTFVSKADLLGLPLKKLLSNPTSGTLLGKALHQGRQQARDSLQHADQALLAMLMYQCSEQPPDTVAKDTAAGSDPTAHLPSGKYARGSWLDNAVRAKLAQLLSVRSHSDWILSALSCMADEPSAQHEQIAFLHEEMHFTHVLQV